MAAIYGEMWKKALIVAVGIGLLGANVLTVNNVRDVNDDKIVGKRTKAVIFGVKAMKISYIICTYLGIGLIWYAMHQAMPSWGWAGYAAVCIWSLPVIIALFKFSDFKLNKVLRYTAILMLTTVAWTIVGVAIALQPKALALSAL